MHGYYSPMSVCVSVMHVFIVINFSSYRLALAALHFNENASRKQAVSRDCKGKERYDILYPKYKKGGHIVQKVTVNPTYCEYIVLSACVCVS